MSARPALHDVPCAPDGGGCNDLTARTERQSIGAGVTVLWWACGHADIAIRTTVLMPVHGEPDRSHETRHWHPADTRDALTEALAWIDAHDLHIGLEER